MLTLLDTYVVCVTAIVERVIGDSCVINACSCVYAISAMDDGNFGVTFNSLCGARVHVMSG